FSKQYDAILATPVRAMEIAFGELLWAMARGALYSAAFLVIMVATGLTSAGWAVGAFVAALLVGFAFGSVGMALSTFMTSWQDFDLFVTVQVALFLFSSTFTPLHNIGSPVLRGLVQVSPLYQSVALVRSLTLADLNLGMLVNVGYLAVMSAIGLAVASRRMNKILLK
ncbi:MAG TPA: ABC transporter permease, partial [Micromonosporaceae bacterium]|nr:ABC transporter permease [Micromonosporaceae bacterium]